MKPITTFARINRKTPTDAESRLWSALRKSNLYHWQRQFSIENKYITDSICRSKRLIIECDGKYHNDETSIEYDKQRDEFLTSRGYKVLRFTNQEIMKDTKQVVNEINNELSGNKK
jgi:5-methyltetrahydrofolate--homocysteine methyltransferase